MKFPEFDKDKAPDIIDKETTARNAKDNLLNKFKRREPVRQQDKEGPELDPVSGKPLLVQTRRLSKIDEENRDAPNRVSPSAVAQSSTVIQKPSPHTFIPTLPEKPVKIPMQSMIEIHKEAVKHSDEPKLKERSIYTVVDKVVVMAALLVMVFGTYILYNELPTHPLLVMGIVLVCISAGIITSIARW